MVSVVVDNVSGRSFGWSVTISADLCELVTLERDPSKRTHAPTWEALLTLLTFPDRNSGAQGVRQEIRDTRSVEKGRHSQQDDTYQQDWSPTPTQIRQPIRV